MMALKPIGWILHNLRKLTVEDSKNDNAKSNKKSKKIGEKDDQLLGHDYLHNSDTPGADIFISRPDRDTLVSIFDTNERLLQRQSQHSDVQGRNAKSYKGMRTKSLRELNQDSIFLPKALLYFRYLLGGVMISEKIFQNYWDRRRKT